MQDLQQLKQIVLTSQDKDELYLAEIELTELSSSLHKAIRLSEFASDQGEHKGNLSLATALIGICRERQQEMGNLANRINYNFRMAAKLMLKKETYEAIWQKSQLPRRDVKAESGDLRSKQME